MQHHATLLQHTAIHLQHTCNTQPCAPHYRTYQVDLGSDQKDLTKYKVVPQDPVIPHSRPRTSQMNASAHRVNNMCVGIYLWLLLLYCRYTLLAVNLYSGQRISQMNASAHCVNNMCVGIHLSRGNTLLVVNPHTRQRTSQMNASAHFVNTVTQIHTVGTFYENGNADTHLWRIPQ